jgi:uncharacterized membrane protein YtjA (UPF0391 family)
MHFSCRATPRGLVAEFIFKLVREDRIMLRWALIFLIVALIASAFGMWNLEGTAVYVAQILFVVFLVMLVISLVAGRRGPVI